MATDPKDWKWFGNPGHFICARWCRFHLCTQVGKYLVSTVGEYVHPRHSGGGEQAEFAWLKANPLGEDIGCERKFETMVFTAGEPCDSPECGKGGCGLPELAATGELHMEGYNTRKDATEGHRRICEEYAAKE